jgi:hypothetical protein
MSTVKLMLDSGAFSAWKRRKVIDVGDYIRFVKKHEECLWCYINLDVIPGRPGSTRTQHQVNQAAEEGWRNYRAMRKAGLSPMPVYHMGESTDWLKRMIDDGAEYIGIGGVATVPDRVRRPFLDNIFDFFCGQKGYSAQKLHGFGITSPGLIHRYPWFSTDSITWVSCGARGDIIVPKWDERRSCYDYRHKGIKVGFSKGAEGGLVNRGHLRGEHFSVLGFSTKAYVSAYLAKQKMEPTLLMRNREARLRINARFFKRCAEEHEGLPYSPRGGIFSRVGDKSTHREPTGKYRLIFSGADTGPDAEVLTEEAIKYRLMSYFIFMDGSTPVHIPSYVDCGYVLSKEKRRAPAERVRIRE